MLAQQGIATIRRLYYNDRQSIKKIALQLSISRNTVRRWIRKESSTPVYSPQRQFLIENREEIRQLFLECEGNCLPLNRQIKFRWNITIHIRMLERFCEEFRREVKVIFRTKESTKRHYASFVFCQIESKFGQSFF